MSLSHDDIHAWADDRQGPVAVHLRQTLKPVEGEGGVIFPPTYAGGKYNIDKLQDGTLIATIDSVGAQANRMEPVFRSDPHDPARTDDPEAAALVPQIAITYGNKKAVSIFEAGHRLGDALVRSTELKEEAQAAFRALLDSGDASPIAKLAPTSLVFGAWDSRDTQAKLPRLVQSVIRAEDVSELTRSAQYFPPVNYAELGVADEQKLEEAESAARQGKKSELAQRGFVAVPSVDTPGGVIAHGQIRRDVTVNLVALRRLDGEEGQALRRYILGLALVAATAPQDGFLRAGCQLVPTADGQDGWKLVDRDGTRSPLALDRKTALGYARAASDAFGKGRDWQLSFDKSRAMADRKAKD